MNNNTEVHMQPQIPIPNTVLQLAKSLSVKLQEVDGDEVNVARLKFSGLFLQRDTVDALLDRPAGWFNAAFFGETGDPLLAVGMSFPKLELAVNGTIRGIDSRALKLTHASLTGVSLTLTRLGAWMAGELAWIAAGDEVSDLETLLGRECGADWIVTPNRAGIGASKRANDKQVDAFAQGAAA